MDNPHLNDCCGMGFVGDEDGFFYCPVCGSQSQDTFDTSLEVDAVYQDSIYGRVVWNSQYTEPSLQTQSQEFKISKAVPSLNPFQDETSIPLDFGNPKRPALNIEAFGDGIRMRYIQGIQVMIQMQCEALVQKFGVSAMICGIVGTIWLRFVATSGVFADGWVNDVIMESEVQYQNRQGGEKDRENVCLPVKRRLESEPYNLYGQRAAIIWFRTLRRKIPRASSLAISFLACHIARESVLPTDIARWTLEGKLPYLAAFVDIEKCIGNPSSMCPFSSKSMFRPSRAIKSWQIETLAGSIAQTICLQLPPVNFYLIASRFLNQLFLPIEKILPHACCIFEWLIPPDLWLSANPDKLPTRACVMSILIVAIRFLYNIHGFGIWEMSLSKGGEASKSSSGAETSEYNSSDLLHHLKEIYHRLGDKLEYSKDLTTYLKYCKDVAFPGLATSYDEDNIAEQLWNFYKSDEDSKLSVGAETGCSAFNQKRFRDAEHDIRSMDDKAFKSREQIKSEPYNSMSFFVDTIPDREDYASQRMNGETSSSNRENPLPEDMALRRMIADMEKNNFGYIPPRGVTPTSRRDGYLFYRRVISGGVYNYVAHADYYILLRACARVVQVDVRIMHASVQKLERRLAGVDEWIDKLMQTMTGPSCERHKSDSMDVA
ncbi:TATA box-binding protein-associated factor RNA polymerase I subunit B [Aristolochia californica]|uniref:TATA box-binding protein-associated factor RNA polymerase I subunit B n=1 Tax=Aristolochia californica TaxID=171875 RepID=UPI0035D87153